MLYYRQNLCKGNAIFPKTIYAPTKNEFIILGGGISWFVEQTVSAPYTNE